MEIKGTFKDIHNLTYEVKISGNGPGNIDIDTSDDIFFAEEPVNIEYDMDDLFLTIICKSCTISLVTSRYLGDMLYSNNERDISVEILKNGTTIFAGFVEPNVYSQGYANKFDTLDIICTDYLSTLQYKNIYSADTGNKTFQEILEKCGLTTAYADTKIYFDDSVEVRSFAVWGPTLFEWLQIPIDLFYNEVPEDSDTCDVVLDEILKYCNLHIIQEGKDFYIFSNYKTDYFVDLANMYDNNREIIIKAKKNDISPNISGANYSSDSSSISLDETYNTISVECDLETNDIVIESPLEKSTYTSPYLSGQLYAWETLWGNGNYNKGEWDIYAWNDWKLPGPIDYTQSATDIKGFDETKQQWFAWYCRLLAAKNWICKDAQGNDPYAYNGIDNNTNQHHIFETAGTLAKHFTPFICQFGKSENYVEAIKTDSDIPGIPKMSNYLVWTINGNGINEPMIVPQGSSIEYNNTTDMNLSPSDDKTTNYLIFSGQILLQGVLQFSNAFYGDNNSDEVINREDNNHPFFKSEGHAVWTKNGKELHNMDFYTYTNPSYDRSSADTHIKAYWKTSPYYNNFLTPPTENAVTNDMLIYEKSGNGKINKVEVLECELKVGNKYLKGYKENIGMANESYKFVWTTTPSTFTIGFNPKYDDTITNTTFDIENTWTGLDEHKGLAIPIKKSDRVSGKLSFKILSPVNGAIRNKCQFVCDNIDTQTDCYILPFVSSIYIKEFECKIISDNAGIDNLSADKDLIYINESNTNAINKKDDIKFKINTALTSDEAYKYHVKNGQGRSNVLNGNGAYISEISSVRYLNDKPEALYIKEYCDLYSKPNLIYETELFNNLEFHPYCYYTFNCFKDKNFKLMGLSNNLRSCRANAKFREIG